MKHTHNWLNKILSILLICVMISQTCFSVYGTDLGFTSGTEVTDISDNFTSDPETDTTSTDTPMSDGNEEIQSEESEFSTDSTVEAQSESTMESAGADEVSKLVLNENESKTLTLTTDTEYSGIELGDGSTLSVDTQNCKFTVTGDITGKGKIILKGNNIKVQNISVSDLVFDGATVAVAETDSSEKNTYKIVAAESLTIQNSEIHNAAFLGYDENATGDRTLTFSGSGNSLYNITLVGACQSTNVNVWISGVSLITNATNTSFCYDNKITYKDQENVLTAAENWPISYRSTYSGNTSNATVTGYHTLGTEETPGAFVAVSEGSVPLPEYTKEGYVYNGWLCDESQEAVKSLPQKLSGDITLYASMTASELTVTTDLGYEPSADTNDNYKEIKKEESRSASWDEAITLSKPSRFGYTFTGWKVTKESDNAQNQVLYTDTYTTNLQDAQQIENGSYVISLEAQWTAKSFPFRVFIKDADVTQMQVKVGNQSYDSVQSFADAHEKITWNPQTSQLELPDIQYGESMLAYMKEIGMSEVPELVDMRNAQLRKEFEGWTTPGGSLLTGDAVFALGGILNNRADSVSLVDYEKSISSTPLFLTSAWKDTEYKMTVENGEGWEILINDEVKTLDEDGNAELTVEVGSSITFRCSAENPENFSLWKFSDGFLPEETQYSSGAKYISYTTVMPYSDVRAVYTNSSKTYIDIAQSTITFEENVNLLSGRTVDGFWYDEKMKATTFNDMNVNTMTPAFQAEESDEKHAGKYFYIWDSKDIFHVTSCDRETQNQLTLVNSMTVSLKACKLTATEAYKNGAVGRKLNGILLEGQEAKKLTTSLAGLDLRQYGNIVLDVKTHAQYTTQIQVEGENAVGVIVQSRFDGNSSYTGTLNVNGITGKTVDKLTISGTLLNEHLDFESLTLLQDQNVSSEYLLYCSAINEGIGNISFSGCDIEAPDKRIHTYRGVLTLKQNSENVASSMKIGGARTYGASTILDNGYVRCLGDWIGAYNTLNLYSNSSVVIDGNLMTTYSHWTAGALINTTGYLIVKGNHAELENLTMTSGTVIANAAVLGRSCNITGGTVIANQLINSPAKYPTPDSDGNYVYNDGGSCEELTKNEDNYPFKTYSQNNAKSGKFLFGGTSRMYLLGYYKTSGDRVYDMSVKATDNENPVAVVIGKVIDSDGDLNTLAKLSDTELQTMVESSRDTQNECVMFGNSTYNTAAKMRSVLISGAEIYAAGNLTFFNDTEITSGGVYCNGKLSGKRDLTISGTAQVTATEVGNNYNLTTTDDSGITRWQKTTISGGTVTADQLGAASVSYVPNSDMISRSTLAISGNPTIKAKSEKKAIEYVTDVYLNYLADEETFSLPEKLPVSVHYTGNDYQNLTMDQTVTLPNPTLKTETGTANWVLDSMTGESVDTIDTNAAFSFQNIELTDTNAYKDRDQICFYAVKGTYGLSVAEGKNQISQIKVGTVVSSNFDTVISADRGAEVTVTLKDASMAGKSIIWYQDAAGKFYNVNPKEATQNGQTTLIFTMPAASVQIYVTDEMKLYLNRYEISITNDGFCTQYNANKEGNSFTYAGNLVITQDNIQDTEFVGGSIGVNGILERQTSADSAKLTGATKNRLHIESVNPNRSIILNKIIMDGGMDEDKIIIEENCGNVELQIDGAVRVLSTYLQTGSELTWKGKNQKAAGENGQDVLQFDSGTASTANITGFIHNGMEGQTENVTFDHLNIIRSSDYYAVNGSTRRPLVYSPTQKTSAVVTFKDCNMKAKVESSMTLVSNYPKVVMDNCDFAIEASTGWNSPFFNSCSEITIKGGSFSYSCGASYNAFPLYYGAKLFYIDGAKVSLNNGNSEDGSAYQMVQPDNMIPDTFTVQNAGELNVNHRIKLKKLTLSSGGKVYVGENSGGTYDGSLLCKDITVEKGEIHTGRILISGYYSAPYTNSDYMSKNEILAQLRAENNMAQNGTLILKEGIIEATEEIGGALGGTITVEGGQITSPKLGSCDKLYGYGKYLPTKTENEWIYSISRVPEKLTVQVNGGTVTVPSSGYLGGMNTAVYIAGGKVNLQGDAVLGMTEAQKKQLSDYYSSRGDDIAEHTSTNCLVTVSGGSIEQEDNDTASGSILAPYGSVKISGTATKIKVSNILADRGSIQICEANDGYENPYLGTETGQYRKKRIGVWVLDTILAETLNIIEGAQVYTQNAYAIVRKLGDDYQGALSVKEAGLYATSYGEKGVSRTEEDKKYNDKSNNAEQTVFGTRLVSVTYVLNPQNVISQDDLATVTNESPTNYTVTPSDEETKLKDAECQGYNFLGWYTDSECSGDKTEKLNTTIANDVTLYAKWERIRVTFQVMIDENSTGNYNDTEFEGNTKWKAKDDGYVSEKTVELPYGDRILATAGVNLMDYTTNTLGITELEIQEDAYSGPKDINVETMVSKDLAEFYKTKVKDDKNAVLILHVKNVQKRIASVTFSVNKRRGKPVDAAFDDGSIQISANIGVGKKVGEVSGFGDESVTDEKSPGLRKPKATGYTFIGWNTDASATKDTKDGWIDAKNIFKNDTTVYAIWQANTYLIEFKAGDGSWVTSNDTEPEVNAPKVTSLSYYWIYDTPVSEDHSFWLKDTSNDRYMTEMPYAWREGYVFDHNKGWTYSYIDENGNTATDFVVSTEELSKLAVKALNAAFGDPNGNPQTTALIITASYTPVTVTYHKNDGKWSSKDAEDQVKPAYGTALAGYVEETDSSQNEGEDSAEANMSTFSRIAEMTGENGSKYYVADTTAEYFVNNSSKYVESDYRKVISRKGYTFYGWYKSQDAADAAIADDSTENTMGISVGTAPRFRNVDLYAAWKPNSYTLQIKNKDGNKTYSYTSFGVPTSTPDSDASVSVSVTTGQEIAVNNWPSRDSANAWYVQDKNENADTTKRYFLGATFAALDPGAKIAESEDVKTIYSNYITALTNLEKTEALYQNKAGDLEGTVFKLPEDNSYRSAIAGTDGADTYTVPDYPDGSEISMYAVYREQSIVFVERYIDKDGVLQEKIKHTADWNTWSNYPGDYSNSVIEYEGYTLVGWYVNSTTVDESMRYPADVETYKSNLENYQKKAAENGTYDIMVYTVYAPKISRDVVLNALSDSTSTISPSNTYTLPGSMQMGIFSMVLSGLPDELQLISRNELQTHVYDRIWKDGEKTYTSDTAIAIEITVNNPRKGSVTKDLSLQSGEILGFENREIGAEDQITLTLYHSKVMTTEKSYSFNLNAKFTKDDGNGGNTLENQLIDNKITIKLTPSVYTVNYSMELPETLDKLTILKKNGEENWGDFGKPEDASKVITKQVRAGYGSNLLMDFPEIEGYTKNDGWKVAENTVEDSGLYTKLTMQVSAENRGVINLSSGYAIQTYGLSADTNVLSRWKVTYSDGPDGTIENELTVNSSENSSSADVKYHSVITFEPKASSSVNPAEFVTLTLGNGSDAFAVKLSDYAATNNSNYTFTMPAQNIAGSYVTVETLYLEEGTISITETGYTQEKTEGTVNKTWRGDYQILQNAQNSDEKSTANTLILAGNLLTRKISLGNLNISVANSVKLIAGNSETHAKAVLTMDAGSMITAKNIQVPGACELTLKGNGAENSGENVSDVLNLTPEKTDAAVGGTAGEAANGKITLQNLNMNFSMPAGSVASGIGPARRDINSAGDIKLDNCSITVAEGSTTEVYQGVWVGGNNASDVTMNQVSLNAENANHHMAGPAIVAGEIVNIKNSKLGSTDNNVSDPVYAVAALNIEDSEIYMNIQDNISAQTVKVPIGTLNPDGQTTIKNSEIKVVKAGLGAVSDIYSGSMKIQDAISNVLIDGTQLIETSNGSMELNGSTYTQNDIPHEADASRKNYWLLEEVTIPQTAPDLIVKTVPESAQVEIQQPVTIGNLTIQQSINLILNGNLEVTGSAVIQKENTDSSESSDSSAAITATVTANKSVDDSVYGISFQSSDKVVFANAKGSNYIQNGGKLSSSTDFSDGSMNVTLNDVTATVPNLYADELTIESGSVTANATTESAVGSKPSENSVSVVTIKNASVTADLIGALGQYDKTFTSVNIEKATLSGNLIQDHYRLNYDTGKAEIETKSLNHTVRTKTQMSIDTTLDSSVTVSPENGIPGNPTGTDSGLFGCWYINTNSGREALLSQDTAFPAGLNKRTILSGSTLENVTTNDITNNADGTKTLTVHAWLKATGTVTIKEGRVFKSFDNGGQTVTVKSNGAWTAQLVSTAASVENRDYLVDFDSALPKGTTLTLTEPATALSTGKYYWYKVASEDVSSVRFTDFTVMGGTEKFKSVTKKEEIPENETFLLSVDFANTSAMANLKQQVSFKLLSSSEVSSSEAIDMASVSYILTEAVKGNVTVSDQTVSVSIPKNAEQLNEQKLFLQAVITSKVSSDANIQATWGNKTGTWLSRDTVLFEIGEYDLIASDLYGEYSFSGLENGTYQISWSIVYGASATDNISGNIISNIAISNYIESHAEPFLKVTANTNSRVLAAGTEQTLEFSYESTAEDVSVAVQKQEDLCKFTSVSEGVAGVEKNTNGCKVTFKETAAPGTYRICFSLNDTSSNDNVYFTFIIK